MSNKYDCTLNLSSHNSLSIILHQIVPGSKILEIGPSTGRMTRYLKETLNCDVWIIECDREAFEIARQYASCGICADVEQLDWDLTFEKIRFDYVICADVLEHLRAPEQTLHKARSVLQDDGKLFLSLPNVGHFTVLQELLNGHFRYTETGVLDRTHLRFFTYDTAKELIFDSGFKILSEDATYYNDGDGTFSDAHVTDALRSELIKIPYASVFQFVFTAVKDCAVVEDAHTNIKIGSVTDIATLYYDDGSGFQENNKLQADKWFFEEHKFRVVFDRIDVPVKALRFDPCEYACQVQILNCRSSVGILTPVPVNSNGNQDGYDKFMTLDPQYIIKFDDFVEIEDIEVVGLFQKISFQELYAFQIENAGQLLEQYRLELLEKDQKIHNLGIGSSQKKQVIAELQQENTHIYDQLEKKSVALAMAQASLSVKDEELNDLRTILAEKEQKLTELHQEKAHVCDQLEKKSVALATAQASLSMKDEELNDLHTILAEKEQELTELHQEKAHICDQLEKKSAALNTAQASIVEMAHNIAQQRKAIRKYQLNLRLIRQEKNNMEGYLFKLLSKK